MASISILNHEEDKANYLNIQNNIEKLKMLNDKEGDTQTTFMFEMMDDLIRAMQQLQKMIVVQVSTQNQPVLDKKDKQSDSYDKNTNIDKIPKSQAAILLHQVQKAMEATVAQLSTSGRILKPLDNPEPNSYEIKKIEEPEVIIKELTTSEKWRLYTDLVQKKDDSSKDYCLMKMRLGQDLGLSFNETKREMLIGLWGNRLCTVLYLKSHKTEEDIVDDIEEWERIERARSDIFKSYRNKYK